MIKAVFIDIDNTLLSFTGYVKQAMREGFAELSLAEYDESMYQTFKGINDGLWEKIERGELTLEGLKKIRWNMVFEALGIDYDGVEFEKYFRAKLFSSAIHEPNAMELLEYLAPRYTLCAASNGPYEQQVNRLKVGGMLEFFSHLFISSEIGAQKPSKEFFATAFARLRESGFDIRPEEAIIIGDSMTSDMAGGTAYGMKTCLYRPNPDVSGGKAASCEGVDFVITDLAEIKGIL